jgi:hypothetical protein
MKQRITIEQLNKLTDEQKERLREWWTPQTHDVVFYRSFEKEFVVEGYTGSTLHFADGSGTWSYDCLPLLSIGQMIQFINEKKPLKSISKARFDKWTVNIETATLGYKDELCDSLWETVTRIL